MASETQRRSGGDEDSEDYASDSRMRLPSPCPPLMSEDVGGPSGPPGVGPGWSWRPGYWEWQDETLPTNQAQWKWREWRNGANVRTGYWGFWKSPSETVSVYKMTKTTLRDDDAVPILPEVVRGMIKIRVSQTGGINPLLQIADTDLHQGLRRQFERQSAAQAGGKKKRPRMKMAANANKHARTDETPALTQTRSPQSRQVDTMAQANMFYRNATRIRAHLASESACGLVNFDQVPFHFREGGPRHAATVSANSAAAADPMQEDTPQDIHLSLQNLPETRCPGESPQQQQSDTQSAVAVSGPRIRRTACKSLPTKRPKEPELRSAPVNRYTVRMDAAAVMSLQHRILSEGYSLAETGTSDDEEIPPEVSFESVRRGGDAYLALQFCASDNEGFTFEMTRFLTHFNDVAITGSFRQHYAAMKWFRAFAVAKDLPSIRFDAENGNAMPFLRSTKYGWKWDYTQNRLYNCLELMAQLQNTDMETVVNGSEGCSGGIQAFELRRRGKYCPDTGQYDMPLASNTSHSRWDFCVLYKHGGGALLTPKWNCLALKIRPLPRSYGSKKWVRFDPQKGCGLFPDDSAFCKASRQ